MKHLAALLLLVALATAACSFGGGGASETAYVRDDCKPRDRSGRSVARVWNEALLHAIERDTPAPTVHARNLFHVSAAMWDAWAAYGSQADGWLVREKLDADDVQAARETALSFAAYRLLLHRYSYASGLQETFDELVATLEGLCYRIDYVETEGDSPAAFGNRIAAAYIRRGREDGANETLRYAEPAYNPANPPLVVSEPGTKMRDPSTWQPLALARIVAQNGIPQPGSVQSFVGPHWGHVAGFALPASDAGVPIDPGPPPRLDASHGRAYKRDALAVIRHSADLDPRDGVSIDIGPGARGGNSLGANDGHGHGVNPATGKPYAPNVVARGDYARALAEYWADGPRSETPPGHWNSVANEVSDSNGLAHRIGGRGRQVDRLEWDVKLYLALNGAVHDAAVGAWGLKGHYDSARPISMIRYLGARNLLPTVSGVVERRRGETFVRAWAGFPKDPASQASGVRWVRAVDWVPYQLPTFVTPAFAGYVSGHSTFSRAAAEVLTAFTGSSFFPGGLYEVPVPRGALKIEQGPSRDVTLQWATYFDAADAAGTSRLWMGIHVPPDDFAGRRVGAQCGKAAWERAQRHFEGAA
ncbi:MAG TPA: vanadium-dependent haloperoxidase [Gaiellaceae bacterium]